MSILARLFILVTIAVLPALAIQGYNQFELRREQERAVRENALRLATFASGELDRILENGFGLLSALTRVPAVRDGDSAACSAYFAELKQQFPQFKVIGATDARGNVFCASSEITPGFNLSNQPTWRHALDTGEFTIGKYHLGTLVKSPILPLALAFRDRSGDIAGVVYVSLDLDWLARYFAEKQFDRNATISIADRNATILLRLPDNERFVGTAFSEIYHRYIYANEPGTDEIIGVDGVRRILGYVPVAPFPASGLYVGIGLTREAAFAAIDRATLIGVVLLTVGFVLALAAAWIGGQRFISRPIASLVEAAGHWRRGDFGVRIRSRGGGEIALLGNAFDEMAAELAKQQQENATLLATLEQRVADRTRELAREVEERQKAEIALVQSQKMEAVGQLTGGVAHDFNNLLTAVIGNLELAEMRLDGGADRALRHIVDARRSAERGARLTQDLLAFSRKQSLRVEAVDLNEVVHGSGDLVRRTVGPNVRIDHRLDPLLWASLADSRQMELVILNLSINARDAMPEGGTITVATANVPADDPHRPAGLPVGDYVRLTVSDTGSGMAPEVLARCLEPFFTTKEIGKGSGLGLSVVHGIATQSGGGIEIRSEPGHGTCVSVYLPRADAEPTPDRDLTASGSEGEGDEPLAARVLLVDDDPEVRQVLAAQLKEFGCSVLEAASGDAALALFGDPEIDSFDVLVSDYAMPGLSGTGLARAIREREPDMPVLLITGYNDPLADSQAVGSWVWLRKPFRRRELREHIGRAVAARKSTAERIA